MSSSNRCAWKRTLGCSSLALMLAMAIPGAEAAAGNPRGASAPLSVEAALDWKSFYPQVRMSPDQEWVAYGIHMDKAAPLFDGEVFLESGGSAALQAGQVQVVHLVSGRSQFVDPSSGQQLPVWSPDGRYLAFISNREARARVWLWDRQTQALRLAADAGVHHYGSYNFHPEWDALQWSADGRHILVRLLGEGKTAADAARYILESEEATAALYAGSTVQTYKPSVERRATNWRRKVHAGDLGWIDVATGQVTRLVRDVHALSYHLSPDQEHIAFFDWKEKGLDLVLYSRKSGDSEVVVERVSELPPGLRFKWSPDGRQFAVVSDGRCRVFDTATRTEKLTLERPRFSPWMGNHIPPFWDAASGDLYWVGDETLTRTTTDGRQTVIARLAGRMILEIIAPSKFTGEYWTPPPHDAVFVRVWDEVQKRRQIVRIRLADGSSTIVHSAEGADVHESARVEAGLLAERLIYSTEDLFHPPDLWLVQPSGRARQLTQLNPAFEHRELGSVRLIEWLNKDGVARRGGLLLPPGHSPGKKHPLVTWVYGSSLLSNSVSRFGGEQRNLFLLTTRGFAVFYPDSRVGTGTQMQDIAGNVLPGINRAIELGLADADRLGVMGHSFGGYSTLALTVQSTRFKAAVFSAGISNIVSYYGGAMGASGVSEGVWFAEGGKREQGSLGGSPWEYRERYIESSPFFYLDRIETPVLILHGEKDPVPVAQADELYIGLRRLGKEVEYARYAKEGHGISYYPNQVDYWMRVISWFQKHLSASATLP